MRYFLGAAAFGAFLMLCGCGQKGPLVLPDAQPHKAKPPVAPVPQAASTPTGPTPAPTTPPTP